MVPGLWFKVTGLWFLVHGFWFNRLKEFRLKAFSYFRLQPTFTDPRPPAPESCFLQSSPARGIDRSLIVLALFEKDAEIRDISLCKLFCLEIRVRL